MKCIFLLVVISTHRAGAGRVALANSVWSRVDHMRTVLSSLAVKNVVGGTSLCSV